MDSIDRWIERMHAEEQRKADAVPRIEPTPAIDMCFDRWFDSRPVERLADGEPDPYHPGQPTARPSTKTFGFSVALSPKAMRLIEAVKKYRYAPKLERRVFEPGQLSVDFGKPVEPQGAYADAMGSPPLTHDDKASAATNGALTEVAKAADEADTIRMGAEEKQPRAPEWFMPPSCFCGSRSLTYECHKDLTTCRVCGRTWTGSRGLEIGFI